ncbi:MAG: TIGR00730 family Rossman fold protein [Desulfobacterales bacterium]|nr:TIGR00730 family Rossman fold protein [Desulfobacterales bacterium]
MKALHQRICVYCGSNPGARPQYATAAKALGQTLAKKGIGLVYGGSGKGLMGILADSVLAEGGEAIGVITHQLKELGASHEGLTELKVVETMHERKALMAELSDGFIAMPGGIGTLEELFEALTWSQLGIHKKSCGLYNVEAYYAPLVTFLETMQAEKFFKGELSHMLAVESTPEALLDAMAHLKGASGLKWFDEEPCLHLKETIQ